MLEADIPKKTLPQKAICLSSRANPPQATSIFQTSPFGRKMSRPRSQWGVGSMGNRCGHISAHSRDKTLLSVVKGGRGVDFRGWLVL